jgi:hypothetical protein
MDMKKLIRASVHEDEHGQDVANILALVTYLPQSVYRSINWKEVVKAICAKQAKVFVVWMSFGNPSSKLKVSSPPKVDFMTPNGASCRLTMSSVRPCMHISNAFLHTLKTEVKTQSLTINQDKDSLRCKASKTMHLIRRAGFNVPRIRIDRTML